MMTDILQNFNIIISNVWLASALDASCVLLLFLFTSVVLKNIERRSHSKISGPHTSNVLKIVFKLSRRLLVVLTLYFIADTLPTHKKYDELLLNTSFVVGVYFCLISIFDIVDAVMSSAFRTAGREFVPLISRLVKFLVGLIALMVLLRHFNYDIWHIVTALGIGSLAIGLAAQPTLMNIIAGFNLLIDRPFMNGDRIKLSSNEIGDVVHIGLRTTHIQLIDGNMMIAPNTDLVNSRVVNFSEPTTNMASNLKFLIDQHTDIDVAKEKFAQGLVEIEGTIGPCKVLLSGITEGNYEIRIGFKSNHFVDLDAVSDRILLKCVKIAMENHIAFAVPALKAFANAQN